MADRDGILLDFQQCTGVDDLDTCISILEHHEWNLQAAVLAMMDMSHHQLDSPPLQHHPQFIDPMFGSLDTDSPSSPGDPPVDLPTLADGNPLRVVKSDTQSSIPPGVASGSRSGADDSTSSSFPALDPMAFGGLGARSPHRVRMLNFRVEYRLKNVDLALQDSNTVAKIKELLSLQLNVPVTDMELRGWPHKNDQLIKDADVLRDLHLPKENTLYLLTPQRAATTSSSAICNSNPVQDLESRTYELDIHFVDQCKNYVIKFQGSQTIRRVKEDVVNVAGPVRYQLWTGWPTDNDSVTLAASGIDYPTHKLRLTSQKNTETSNNKVDKQPTRALTETGNTVTQPEDSMEVESDDEDFVDATQYDDITDDVIQSYKPLIPDNCEDQMVATEHFSREFASRYGETHPVFYIGSLDDAIRDALQCKARDRKLLAIYMHHDHSILSNVFASQVLCDDSMVNYLCANFITWAWDLTHDSNRDILLQLTARHFGSVAANTVRLFNADQLPLLLIISRNRGINEVQRVLHGNSTLDELMSNLMTIVESFKEQLQADIVEETERDKRERVLEEQDAAYKESLEIDRAKAEQKRKEEEERMKEQVAEELKRIQKEQLKEEQEAENEAIRISLANMLPDEPPADCQLPVSLIRFRCPGGVVLNRRFLASETLQVLLTYVGSVGYHLRTHKVLATYPRRDLSQLDKSLTLHDLKLFPQETLTLEERS